MTTDQVSFRAMFPKQPGRRRAVTHFPCPVCGKSWVWEPRGGRERDAWAHQDQTWLTKLWDKDNWVCAPADGRWVTFPPPDYLAGPDSMLGLDGETWYNVLQ